MSASEAGTRCEAVLNLVRGQFQPVPDYPEIIYTHVPVSDALCGPNEQASKAVWSTIKVFEELFGVDPDVELQVNLTLDD